MKCDEVNRRLDASIDGELNASERDEVREHVGACAACAAEEEKLRRLVEAARALPREIAPGRDLWPGIARRIQASTVVAGEFGARRAAWRQGRAWLAAAAVLVVAAGLVVVSRGRPEPPRLSSAGSGLSDVRFAALEVDSVRVTYAKARQELLTLLAARRSGLAPETVKVVEENVLIIDEAVEKIQAALAKDPGNRELNTLLAATYRQEIDLLRQVGTLVSRV
jgi:anti-sigma factor RsiW